LVDRDKYLKLSSVFLILICTLQPLISIGGFQTTFISDESGIVDPFDGGRGESGYSVDGFSGFIEPVESGQIVEIPESFPEPIDNSTKSNDPSSENLVPEQFSSSSSIVGDQIEANEFEGARVSGMAAQTLAVVPDDGDSVELLVGLHVNIETNLDVESYLSSQISGFDAQIVNEVLIDGRPIAFVVKVSREELDSCVNRLDMLDFVRYTEPNTQYQASFTPDDPDWSLQYGPEIIQAELAWDVQMGDSEVIVSVIDTGVDWDHPDLAGNYVALGYDWVNDDTDPMDDHGHGTHCAGVIAAVINNNIGIAGLAQVKVMAEKGLDSGGSGWSDDLANAIIHSVDQGAHILSNSWGSFGADDIFPGFYQLVTWNGNGYIPVDVMEPGKGYWALVLEDTTVTISG